MASTLTRMLVLAVLAATLIPAARAEYADVVLNKRAEKEGARPVIFPHWFHRIRFRCKVCHDELGFKMRAGANEMRMADISNGKFCGMCHNGEIAWGAERCDLCHSGRPGLTSRIYGGHQTMGPGRW
ncbi:MAG: c(7)-type cytochrome triheme domain-containing protein [Betaproteobacteria bacterium]